MNRTGNLYDAIYERENLLLAVQKALRGKRRKGDSSAYVAHLEQNLNLLTDQLCSGEVEVGVSTQFTIHDPKERLITAPCFRERVLHHGIMNICEPEFERRLIYHTYACRRGKGQFAALDRARRLAARHEWFLKMDIRKYFDSIPHDGLLAALERRFKDRRLLNLFERLIRSHPTGLPIGSLISQHCANLYLDTVDRCVTEQQRCGSYVRYMDDFVIWSDDKEELKRMRTLLGSVLAGLGLKFKQEPFLNGTSHGLDFLGHRVFHDRVTLNRRSRVRFAQKLRALEGEGLEAQARATALCAFTKKFGGAAFRLRAMNKTGGVPLAPTA